MPHIIRHDRSSTLKPRIPGPPRPQATEHALGPRLPTAVWTGTEMIVWGGYDDASFLNTGGRYTPSSDSWTATSTGDELPLAPRSTHGGLDGDGDDRLGGSRQRQIPLEHRRRYNPATDSWTATSTGVNCPAARYDHTAVWTGTADDRLGRWKSRL